MRCLAALAFGLLATLGVAQPEPPGLRSEISKVYRSWERKFVAKDVKGLAAMLYYAGSTLGIDGHRWQYSGAKADFADWFKNVRNPRQSVTLNHVRRNGEEVVVWLTATTRYQSKVNGKWRTTKMVTRHADTLKQIGGKWMFIDCYDIPADEHFAG